VVSCVEAFGCTWFLVDCTGLHRWVLDVEKDFELDLLLGLVFVLSEVGGSGRENIFYGIGKSGFVVFSVAALKDWETRARSDWVCRENETTTPIFCHD